jgi:hypothetical protein
MLLLRSTAPAESPHSVRGGGLPDDHDHELSAELTGQAHERVAARDRTAPQPLVVVVLGSTAWRARRRNPRRARRWITRSLAIRFMAGT